MTNSFKDSINLLNKLGKESHINPMVLEYMSNSEQILTVTLPIVMDNGEIKVFTGYRIRHNTVLGPGKGGIRFSDTVSEEVIGSLAVGMMIKNSLVGLPYGGAKGGIIVDPTMLSKTELEKLSRAYIRAIVDAIGPYLDIPAPDVGTNNTIMKWMLDEYETIKGIKSPAVITGKPVQLMGSLFREEATGYGVFYISKLLIDKIGKAIHNTTIAIQGFGKVGYYLAKFLFDAGYKIVAISDVSGGIFSNDGLNIQEISKQLRLHKNKTLHSPEISANLQNVKLITNSELLESEVDILIPAAMENVINEANVHKIQAKYIVEAANGPISGKINSVLEKKNVIIVPDVLANSGGVIVSYFEWVQNLQFHHWTEEKVKVKLEDILTQTFNSIWKLQLEENRSLRSVAYSLSLRRLETVIKMKFNM